LTFQQLALHLVQAVKTLSLFAQGQSGLADKEAEQRLTEVTNIVALGFKMPSNMAISLVQILSILVVDKIPIEKDFLLVKALDLLQKVTRQSD